MLNSLVGTAFSGLTTYQQIKEKNSLHKTDNYSVNILDADTVELLRKEATITCKLLKPEDKLDSNQCNPLVSPCLFNLKDDPCEMVNLANQRPLIAVTLEQEMMKYRSTARKPINVPRDPNADPANYNGIWTNWQDVEVTTKKIQFRTLSHLTIGLISGACVAIVLIIIVLLTLTCRKSPKRSSSPVYEPGNKFIHMEPKSHNLFEEREKQMRTCLKDEFREV